MSDGITDSQPEYEARSDYLKRYCDCTDTIGRDPCNVCHKPKEHFMTAAPQPMTAQAARSDNTHGEITGGESTVGRITFAGNGWTCRSCGAWVGTHQVHNCRPAYTFPPPPYNPNALDISTQNRIAAAYERMAAAMERIARAHEAKPIPIAPYPPGVYPPFAPPFTTWISS